MRHKFELVILEERMRGDAIQKAKREAAADAWIKSLEKRKKKTGK